MIEPRCFTKTWLAECRDKAGRIDPGLLEKSIYAFDLLGRLQAKGLPFVFKGGTCMLLLLDKFRRLSIDVDIVCPLPKGEVARIVSEVAAEGPFLDVEQDGRDPSRLPKRHHYTFRFASVVSNRVPATLLLDVLEDESHYPETQRLPLASRFVIPAEDITIETPIVEGLLADKLTAFAPTTIGIPYGAFKASIKIAKQISDVGELFEHAQFGDKLAEAYEHIFQAENSYRQGVFSMDQALDDTREAALLLGGINLKGHTNTPESEILAKGVGQVDSHMIGRHYTLDHAKIAAARAAHLATLIRHKATPIALRALRFNRENVEVLRGAQLSGPFERLQKLKRVNVEAFDHWFSVQRICT